MLHIRYTIFSSVLTLLLSTCISPYDPEIDPVETGKYVVNGIVTDLSEIQTVSVAKASSVNDPHFIPVTGCYVVIRDDMGNSYELSESGGGNYTGNIDKAQLIPGRSFMVEIMTRDGIVIESDFDKMYECPDVDSVYYLRKDIISNIPGEDPLKGIQFYLNFNGKNVNTHFFRWELIETFEYQVPYPREWYYDGTVHHISPADYSRKVCWATLPVKNIFTLSTKNLITNSFQMMPLNFIDNISSPRLVYGYSLLVNQHSLSEAAYSYWDMVRINSNDQGGLYEKQPLSVIGNLHNLTDPENEVLGFFGVSSVRSKRIHISKVPYLENEYIPLCGVNALRKGLKEIKPDDYPAFLLGNESGYSLVLLSVECVDCLFSGGSNIKPEFWPDK